MQNEQVIKDFGTYIRKLREERKLSQQKLADMANVHKTTIQSIENARYSVTLDVVISISIALDLSLNDLVKVE